MKKNLENTNNNETMNQNNTMSNVLVAEYDNNGTIKATTANGIELYFREDAPNSKIITLTGYKYEPEIEDLVLEIPESIQLEGEKYFVRTLGPYALANCGAKEVVLPSTLRRIDRCALIDMYNAKTLTIPISVEEIDKTALLDNTLEISSESDNFTVIDGVLYTSDMISALYVNRNSTHVSFPEGVIEIPNSLCNMAYKLEQVELPDSLIKIGNYAFSDCYKLQEIKLPQNLRNIGKGAFSSCGFTEITIPASVKVIKEGTFSHSVLSQIHFEGVVERIGIEAFMGCDIQHFELPGDLETIGKMCFAYCDNLESLTIPSSVTRIEPDICIYCSNLVEVNVKCGIEKINDDMFYRCTNLHHIILTDEKLKTQQIIKVGPFWD